MVVSYRDGRLCVEGRPLQEMAEDQGTPFFLLSEARLKANHQALARGLASAGVEARVRYCIKANSESALLEVLAGCGGQALASHPAEAQLALRCGFAPGRLAYQRPVLLEEELLAVLEAGVELFHAHRLSDLDAIEEAAAAKDRPVRVSLRLRDEAGKAWPSPLRFLSRRLGFHAAEVLPAARRIRSSPYLRLAGLNVYQGTQQESARRYRPVLRRLARLAAQIHSSLGMPLEEINLGGGAPSGSLRRVRVGRLWSRLRDDPLPADGPEALEAFARELSASFWEEARAAGLSPVPALALEPGRSIVGNAALLVTQVRAVQGSWVFLDASRNYLGESPLLFRRRILAETEHPGPRRYYHLSGSTLNTTDVVDVRRRLPVLTPGALLALCDAGAYSISRASRYAGLSPAVLLLAEDGSLRVCRRAEDLRDLTGPMVMADDKQLAGR